MRLYTGPMSMFGAKVQVALLEKGLDVEIVQVSFSVKTRYEPKHPEVLRINPKTQVPVLVDGDLEIYDSTQIFEYLEDAYPTPRLWPGDTRYRARARLLEHESDEIFYASISKLMNRASDSDDARAQALRYHATADAMLRSRPYLADDYSYADIAFFMANLFGELLGVRIDDSHAALLNWVEHVGSRPAIAAVTRPMIAYIQSEGLDTARLRQRYEHPNAAV